MSKKEDKTKYQEKYFEVLKKFHLTPNFKLTDYEKEIVKYLDKVGLVSIYSLADEYDLRPSEIRDLVDTMAEKGLVHIEDGNINLTDAAIKYIRATKEERKTEKKFRKFLDTLDEKDLDKFMSLVDSFEVKDVIAEVTKETK